MKTMPADMQRVYSSTKGKVLRNVKVFDAARGELILGNFQITGSTFLADGCGRFKYQQAKKQYRRLRLQGHTVVFM